MITYTKDIAKNKISQLNHCADFFCSAITIWKPDRQVPT